MNQVPKATRPYMPGYGVSAEEQGFMSWDWVETQMTTARNYWISSVTPQGKPHASPVWGVWVDGALYFGCEPDSRKARNFAVTPDVVIHLESGDEVVIFEGVLERITDAETVAKLSPVYAAKYDMPPETQVLDPERQALFRLNARKVMAWLETDFPNTATRWLF